MVGGFLILNIIVDVIKEVFFDFWVVVFLEFGLVVVKGVVLYGYVFLIIVFRVCKYIYGVVVYDIFKEGVYLFEKRLEIKIEVLCKDIFNKFIEFG